MKHTEKELKLIANELRQDVLEMGPRSGNVCHVGPAYSCADILTVLYYEILNIRPEEPSWPDRDRFILSKGHACPILYALLARRGYFSREELWRCKQFGSHLQGHPDMRKTPGLDMTSGSLGNGLGCGLGIAMALKLQKRDAQVFVIMGDGEMQEGLVWESIMAAGSRRVDNLTAIIDYNHLQSGGCVDDIVTLHPLDERFKSFNWNVLSINGHSIGEIYSALTVAKAYHGRPTAIIANTIKGKGVSFMEYNNAWHSRMPSAEELENGLAQLRAAHDVILAE